MKRSIEIEGLGIELELSKVTSVKTDKRMIHFDELPDGTWRLIYNGNQIEDISKVKGFRIVRED
jgi:hypothetical protein